MILDRKYVAVAATTHHLPDGWKFDGASLDTVANQINQKASHGTMFLYQEHRTDLPPVARCTRAWVESIGADTVDGEQHYALHIEIELLEAMSELECKKLVSSGLSLAFFSGGYANFEREADSADVLIGLSPGNEDKLREIFDDAVQRFGETKVCARTYHRHFLEGGSLLLLHLSLRMLERFADAIVDHVTGLVVDGILAKTEDHVKTVEIRSETSNGEVAVRIPSDQGIELTKACLRGGMQRTVEHHRVSAERKNIAIVYKSDGLATENVMVGETNIDIQV